MRCGLNHHFVLFIHIQGLAQFCSSVDSGAGKGSTSRWKLSCLKLAGNDITDKGIKSLLLFLQQKHRCFASLNLLDLSDNHISQECFSALKDCAPSQLNLITTQREKEIAQASMGEYNDAEDDIQHLPDARGDLGSSFRTGKDLADDIIIRMDTQIESKVEHAVSACIYDIESRLARQEHVISALQEKLKTTQSYRQLHASVQGLRIRLEQMEMVVFQNIPGSESAHFSRSKLEGTRRLVEVERFLGETSNRLRAVEKQLLLDNENQLKLQLVIERLMEGKSQLLGN